MKPLVCLLATTLALGIVSESGTAQAQSAPSPDPVRDTGWGGASNALAWASLATQVVMPRVFYADPETTVGWKARWHVSVLAPVLGLGGLVALNELALKDGIKGYRPGCDASNQGTGQCQSYGGPSSQAFAAFSGLGHGAGVFLVDTFKHSEGRVNWLSFTGNVAVPLVLSIFTAVGRGAGSYEDTGQILAGAGFGLGIGALMGVGYSLLQRPECPYGSAAICW